MWFKKNKTPMSILDISSRMRGFIYDSQMAEAHAMSVLLGCAALSDDVSDMEDEASQERVQRVGFLLPLMYAHAHSLAEAATEYQRTTMAGAKEIPDEVWQFSRRMVEQVAFSTVIGSVSQLVDMGLLEVPRRLR
jgi:hypothetical protein